MSDYDEGYRAGMQKMRDLGHKQIKELEDKLAEGVAVGVRVRDYFTHQTNNDVYAVSDFNKAITKMKGQNDE